MVPVTYDPEADALYVYACRAWWSKARTAVFRTEVVADGVHLDYNLRGEIVGIEVLNVTKRPAPGQKEE